MPDPRQDRGGRRWSAATLAVLICCLALGTACGSTPADGQVKAPGAPHAGFSSSGPPTITAQRLPASQPTRIEIPAIGVAAPVGAVGLNPDGTVEVPPLERADDTGWYRYGPTPGEIGPAVVLGHVDSKRGPAVFFRLHHLKAGDTVRILRADGVTAVFRTTSVAEFPKTQFPTDRVYGGLDHAGLRLVTCGGSFDPVRGSYRSNIIVFADFTGAG
jgi:sortase (surface protein transpeptidase)